MPFLIGIIFYELVCAVVFFASSDRDVKKIAAGCAGAVVVTIAFFLIRGQRK